MVEVLQVETEALRGIALPAQHLQGAFRGSFRDGFGPAP